MGRRGGDAPRGASLQRRGRVRGPGIGGHPRAVSRPNRRGFLRRRIQRAERHRRSVERDPRRPRRRSRPRRDGRPGRRVLLHVRPRGHDDRRVRRPPGVPDVHHHRAGRRPAISPLREGPAVRRGDRPGHRLLRAPAAPGRARRGIGTPGRAVQGRRVRDGVLPRAQGHGVLLGVRPRSRRGGIGGVGREPRRRFRQRRFPRRPRSVVHGAHYTSSDDVDEAVRNLARTGYRVFVGVFYTGDYERVMESAHRHGIAGPGYTWILTDGFGPDYFHGKAFPVGSPLAVASQGLGVVMAHGGRRTEGGGTGYDRLMDAWTRQTDRFVDYVNCVGRPRTNSLGDADAYYKADGGFFQDLDLAPPQLVFFYDSVVSFGLAACDLLDGDGEASEIDGGKLADAFVRQEYEGSSGFVSLDPETRGRRPGSAFFAAYNAQGTTREGGVVTFEMDVVAHTVPGKASDAATGIVWTNVSGKAYRYSDNTTDFPRGLPEISDFYDNRIGPVARGTFLFLASVVFASSLFFSGWTVRHRKERVVRSSQPMFLHMICAGTLLMGASIVTLSIDDGIASERACSVACMLNHWFLAIGFAFAFTSLFAKEWRINKIFHNPSLRRIKVEPKDVIVPLVVLLGINILVLTLWTALSPMTWDRYFVGTVDKYGRDLESVGMCVGYAKDWVLYASILLVTNFSAVALASFQAYRARKITVEYTESKWVAVILVAILQAVAIGIPLIALMDGNPTANFVVRAGLIFIICITFLLAMFIPKMIYHNDAVEAAKKKQSQIRESALRRTAFMARVAAQNDGAVDSQNFTPSLRRRSGVRVLFHPKSHEDEMEAMKDELQNTKQELRYLIDQARQSENHELLSCLSRISDVDENDRDTVNSSEPLPLERAEPEQKK
ncbi:hypothetical protein ACHAWF_018402 [Thalassiosira exigua]